MNKAIIDYIKYDSKLISLLGITKDNPKIYPLEHSNNEDVPFLVYSISPIISEEVITQYRAEFRIISDDVNEIESITNAMMNLMHFRRKSGFISNDKTIYVSSFNGGGLLKNPETGNFEQYLVFIVKAK